MDSDITSLLDQYASVEPRRATGGIYAMAGFAFQARVYVAELAEALARSGDYLRSKGEVFVEALSDVARWDTDQQLVLLQVKRTLTPATLDSAAGEIDAIESFVSTTRPELKGAFKYGVVSAFTDGAIQWTDLPKGSLHKPLIGNLEAQGRLVSPRIEQDPWWRAVTAVWPHVDDPYSFARFAFERVLLRRVDPDDARLCRDAIAERYATSRRPGSRVGQLLSAADFAPDRRAERFRLEVGRQATLARMRAGQYMPRDARVAILAERATALSNLAALASEAAIRVLWLSGRSGVGKSVLLLQLLEHLVLSGRRVQWLSGDASLLVRALREMESLPPHEAPEFIAIDDIYDRDAREQLDLSRLASYVDEQGPCGWPVLVTCGPTEFAEAFVDATRFRGFEVTAAPIDPVGGSEAANVLRWVNERRGSAASGQGAAFAQAQQSQGLFVSMATELEFGDLRQFGARFCDRLASAGLQEPLRPLLALNRLYLRAPYRWLEEFDRERLAVLNRDGDFSVLELQPANQLVRLTHPHLSDAIYRVLVGPSNPQAYARDLASAFERSVDEGDYALAARLLRTFSASDRSLLADRLVDVDMHRLAARCVAKWRMSSPGGDRKIQSDMATSWACWRAAHPSLGTGVNGLIHNALETLNQWSDSDARQAHWPAYWWRLWRSHPNDESLAGWAIRKIVSDDGLKIPQWSRIWEALAEHESLAQGGPSNMDDVAVRWLECSQEKADWHFVWKKLSRQGLEELETARRLALAELELPDAPCWAFVFQDMLALAADSAGEVEARALVAQGCTWLSSREDRAEWTYVWRVLLERAQLLPETVDQRALVAQGCTWLSSREDRAEWAYVWRALLERLHLLPETVDQRALVEQGCSWLTGREDRAEWTYVWRALLERPHLLPETVDQRALVAQGCSWLTGREDRAEWTFVWRALLPLHLLPETVDQRALVAQGCSWLTGREDRPDWLPMFLDVLKRRSLLPMGDALRLNEHAPKLLAQSENFSRGAAGHLLESMMDAGLAGAEVVDAMFDWAQADRSHPAWPLIAGKCLQRLRDRDRAQAIAKDLVQAIERHPNAGAWYRLQTILESGKSASANESLASVQAALARRQSAPAWDEVARKLQSGEPVRATITKSGGQNVTVELEGGLFALLLVDKGFSRWQGRDLEVVVTTVQPHRNRVVVSPYRGVASPLPPEDLFPGGNYQGTVTGHQEYGIFVEVRGRMGLVHAKHLGDFGSYSTRFPKGTKVQVRLVEVGPKGLVLTLPLGE